MIHPLHPRPRGHPPLVRMGPEGSEQGPERCASPSRCSDRQNRAHEVSRLVEARAASVLHCPSPSGFNKLATVPGRRWLRHLLGGRPRATTPYLDRYRRRHALTVVTGRLLRSGLPSATSSRRHRSQEATGLASTQRSRHRRGPLLPTGIHPSPRSCWLGRGGAAQSQRREATG